MTLTKQRRTKEREKKGGEEEDVACFLGTPNSISVQFGKAHGASHPQDRHRASNICHPILSVYCEIAGQ